LLGLAFDAGVVETSDPPEAVGETPEFRYQDQRSIDLLTKYEKDDFIIQKLDAMDTDAEFLILPEYLMKGSGLGE